MLHLYDERHRQWQRGGESSGAQERVFQQAALLSLGSNGIP